MTPTKAEALACGYVAWSKLLPILLAIIVSTIGAATFISAQHGSISHHEGAMSADRFEDFRKQFDAYTVRHSEMNQRMWEQLREIRKELNK